MYRNLSYAYSALLLQCLLLFFYLISRHLPTYQNTCFRRMLEIGCIATGLDILTCVMLMKEIPSPRWLLQTALVLYYIAYICRTYYLYEFTLCLTGRKYKVRKRTEYLCRVPMYAYTAAAVTAPWTHFLYVVTPAGVYHHTASYAVLYAAFLFYLLLCLYLVIRFRAHIRKTQCMGFFGLCGFLLVGCVFKYFNNDKLLMNVFYAAGIMTIYLTIQDPSRYLRGNHTYFNQEGLSDLIADHIERKRDMAFICLKLKNYEEIKAALGNPMRIDMEQRSVEHFFQMMVRPMIIFYLGDGCFVLSDQGETKETTFREAADEYFNKSEDSEDTLLTMKAATAYIPSFLPKTSVDEVLASINYLFTEMHRRGQESHVIADAQLMQNMERNFAIDEAIERAIRGASVLPYFQPIYSCRDRKFNSAEVLARINDEKLGFLMPGQFIGNAERSGSILKLDQAVLNKACAFMQENDLEHLGLEYLEVNLSPVYSSRRGLADRIRETVEKYGISKSCLNLEITESAASDTSIMQNHMEALCREGIRFSLDDYGTGYSNMIKILRLPFDIIKIDKSIVWSYFNGENNFLENIIGNFKEGGFKILAEGVETEQMAAELEKMGCDYEQGFYFSKPLPQDEFLAFLRSAQDKNNPQGQFWEK
ncbi:MAG: EAL domain-containing protein [Eubacterium sp.]